MDVRMIVEVLLTALLYTTVSGGDKCVHTQCDSPDCLSYKCEKSAVKPWLQIKCELISTLRTKDLPHDSDCFDLADVYGIRAFCEQSVLITTVKPPQNVIEDNQLPDQAPVCVDSTVSWPLAVGCFVVGCFLTLVVVCIVKCCYACRKKIGKHVPSAYNQSRVEEDTTRTHIGIFTSMDRTNHAPQISRQNQFALLSDDHMPSTVSVDSGLSCSPVGTGVSSCLPSPGGHSQVPGNFGLYPGEATATTSEGFYASTQVSTIYSPSSETSSRDYHSIQGNNYITSSDSESDFKGIKLHRVTLIRGEDIYTASSESSGDDYSSFKNRKFRGDNQVYYPTSESSYKDYTSLNGDRESATYCDVDIEVDREQVEALLRQDGNQFGTGNGNVKFRVRGLVFPQNQQSYTSGPNSDLASINEYETVGPKGSNHDYSGVEGAVGGIPDPTSGHLQATSSTGCDVRHAKDDRYITPDPDYHDYDVCSDGDEIPPNHEYHILEPRK